MGCYINPPTESKEQFLKSKGVPLQDAPNFDNLADGLLPVCLVDNGPFTAAGVAYSKRELEAFTLGHDPRPKKWFLVSIEDLKDVCPLDEYYKK